MQILYWITQILILVSSIASDCDECVEDDYYHIPESQLGPKYKPTKGEVWPTVTEQLVEDRYFDLTPENLELDYDKKSYPVIEKMINRFVDHLKIINSYGNKSDEAVALQVAGFYYGGSITVLKIVVEDDEDLKRSHSLKSEEYRLSIIPNILIEAKTVVGVVRALDTLLQLFYISKDGMVVVKENTVVDSPKFAYRGLMIDSDSNYIPVETIMKLLDAMAMNKLNILHWRIAGDWSFPYESKAVPKLSQKGAYYKNMVYNASAIKNIIDYAAVCGVTVIPELNIPGHMISMKKAYSKITTDCFEGIESVGPLNPEDELTFKIIKNLLEEVQHRFPDDYIHLGGEDVNYECWDSNPDIENFIQLHEVKVNLHLYFLDEIIKKMLKDNTTMIFAQDVFYLKGSENIIPHGLAMSQLYTQHMCDMIKNCSDSDERPKIFSCPYNLGHLDNVSLSYLYEQSQQISKLCGVVGGEAYLFGEHVHVDDTNLFDKLFPRASVIADVLWHGLDKKFNTRNATTMERIHCRLQEHMCRMARLKIPVPPVGAGICDVHEEEGNRLRKSSKVRNRF